MLTRILNRLRSSKEALETSKVASVLTNATELTGNLYAVTLPGEDTVMLRGKNQVEVKAFVREARELKRLPAGTTVERVD